MDEFVTAGDRAKLVDAVCAAVASAGQLGDDARTA
jgi:hypothetical protein